MKTEPVANRKYKEHLIHYYKLLFLLKSTVSQCYYQAEHIETGSLFRNKPYCDLNLFLERSVFLTKKLKELAR